IDWTWDSTGATNARYTWSMDAGAAVRPATGTIGGPRLASPPPPAATSPLSGVTALPVVLNPATDGTRSALAVTFTLAATATVNVTLAPASAAAVPTLTLLSSTLSAGPQSLSFSLAAVADGRYSLSVAA